MGLRSLRERALQTILYEACGFLVALPFYVAATDGTVAEGMGLVVVLWVTVLCWTPLHNTLWDWVEWRWVGRIASDRPQRVRILHALSSEVSSILATVPILMLWGGLSMQQAVALEVALLLVYMVYAWLFHMVYDWWRPVQRPARPFLAMRGAVG
jgi:uncharacterized membrane protein